MTVTEERGQSPGPGPQAGAPARARTSPYDGIKSVLGQVGEIARFGGSVVRNLTDVRKYSTEVLHQTGILILSSGLIIWVMEAVMGTECGLEASYTLKQIGAPIYSGVFDAWCALREMAPYMWGYIFSAKV